MNVTVNKDVYSFLEGLLTDDDKIKAVLQNSIESRNTKSLSINVSEDQAEEIRDFCSDKMQEIGFDASYELTAEGKLLEELVDLFYS